MPDILINDVAEVVPGAETPLQGGEVVPAAAVSEKIPTVTPQVSQDDASTDDASTGDSTVDFSGVEPNVVDMRTGQETLEQIKDTSHKLTAEADEAEEKFITHVEEVHTIAQ